MPGNLCNDRSGQRGIALLTVLVLVVLLGLTAGMAGQALKAFVQQEREAELLWRGLQYRRAIASYYNVAGGPQQMFPSRLEDLLRDPRFPGVTRHLRQLYKDPMTGGDWDVVRDPAERIVGVRSSSELTPFRQSDFPEGLENLEGKGSYREWEFTFSPPRAKSPAKPQGSPTVPVGRS